MNRLLLFTLVASMLLPSTFSQSFQTELRLLPGLASGAKTNPGDLGLGLYAGYEYSLDKSWALRSGLEISTSAWAGQLLAEVGSIRTLAAWDRNTLSARASLHGGMIWFRNDPPLIYGLSSGIRWQQNSGRWRWYISPGIRWLNAPAYGDMSTFSSLTDLELRIGLLINLR